MKKPSAESKWGPPIDLHAIEMEVLREGQEWMRRRMEDKLREAAQIASLEEEKKTRKRPTQKTDD